MIFTGESGEQYGYKDGWTKDNNFLYTGEGQVGDMQFIKGNKAIRDHISNDKDVFLFQYVYRAHVKFLGQVVYVEHEIRENIDRENNLRDATVFKLEPIKELEEYNISFEMQNEALES